MSKFFKGLHVTNAVPVLFQRGAKMFEYSTYKGQRVISLKKAADDEYPFTFGKNKARLIIENIEEIKRFVAEK